MADIRMTEEQLSATIAAAVTAAVDAVRTSQAAPAAPPNRGPLNIEDEPGQYGRIMREATRRVVTDDPELVPCRGETGATFMAQTNKAGIVVSLVDYAEPAEALQHISDGGHYPDGAPIYDGGKLDIHYKQWRYETYIQADLRMFINKPLASRAHLIVKTQPTAIRDAIADRIKPETAAAE